jgi:hypothetical protein
MKMNTNIAVMETKKKMGRPPVDDKRNQYVCTPLTKSEKAILVKYAKNLKTPLSTLIRTLVFQSITTTP